MIMWIFISIAVLAALVFGIRYFLIKITEFNVVKLLIGSEESPKYKTKKRWIPVIIIAIFIIGLSICINPTSAIIVMIHFVAILFMCDLLGKIIRKALKRQCKYYIEGAAAIIITTVVMSVGWYYAYHVYETYYTVETNKNLGMDNLRIAQITDSHVGALFDGEGFAKHMETIQEKNPDIVVVTGDYVDDSTSRKDMIRSCQALGEMKTTYGVYYVFGNHDKGYHRGRDFDADDLREELRKNKVTILEDEYKLIDDKFYIVGRKDKNEISRDKAAELTKNLDKDKYIIMLDHQPNDYKKEQEAGADLVLSGHTHGGQFFPVNEAGVLIGANDKTYGMEKRGETTFIVSSGIADWEIPFKTGTISEFVIVDVKQK